MLIKLIEKSTFQSFEDDFPNPIALDVELDLWEKYWESYTECIPDTVASTLTSIPLSGFENIKIALRILGTLPVTTDSKYSTISIHTLSVEGIFK